MAENKYPVLSADMYFINANTGEYEFDASKLSNAHQWCNERTKEYMNQGISKIFVANTFTSDWEMESYFRLSKEYLYDVFSIIVENRSGTKNVHGVSDEVLIKQRKRFSVKL